MNTFIHFLIYLYTRLLRLYPRRFRQEFAEEMEVVFRNAVNEALKDGILSLTILCLRELGGLPLNILWEFWHEFKRRETKMQVNENANPEPEMGQQANAWEAVTGTLPFVLFGIASILARSKFLFPYPYYYLNYSYSDLVLYVIALIGLFFGLLRGVPRWTYSYLGWSMFLAWSWMGRSGDSFSYPPFMNDQPWGWWSWLPILIVLGLILVLTRSFDPLRKLVRDVWQDWTRLSLAMYASIGWLAIAAGYDENHQPHLFAFIAASTLVISGSVWAFLRSRKPGKQTLALLAGCVAAYIIVRISDASWELGAWHEEVFVTLSIFAFLSLIMFWPILIAFVRRAIQPE